MIPETKLWFFEYFEALNQVLSSHLSFATPNSDLDTFKRFWKTKHNEHSRFHYWFHSSNKENHGSLSRKVITSH